MNGAAYSYSWGVLAMLGAVFAAATGIVFVIRKADAQRPDDASGDSAE